MSNFPSSPSYLYQIFLVFPPCIKFSYFSLILVSNFPMSFTFSSYYHEISFLLITNLCIYTPPIPKILTFKGENFEIPFLPSEWTDFYKILTNELIARTGSTLQRAAVPFLQA